MFRTRFQRRAGVLGSRSEETARHGGRLDRSRDLVLSKRARVQSQWGVVRESYAWRQRCAIHEPCALRRRESGADRGGRFRRQLISVLKRIRLRRDGEVCELSEGIWLSQETFLGYLDGRQCDNIKGHHG